MLKNILKAHIHASGQVCDGVALMNIYEYIFKKFASKLNFFQNQTIYPNHIMRQKA
jgi:hypothetical protein